MYKLNENCWFAESEEYICSLPPQCTRVVTAICPLCKKERRVQFASPIRKGRTFCNKCAQSKKNRAIIGTSVNNVFVLNFVYTKNGSSYFSCRCHCGKEFVSRVDSLVNGSRRSCGCLNRAARYKGGEEHPNYDFTMTDEERNSKEARRRLGINISWKNAVNEMFGSTCFVCGGGENLIAHHIDSYKKNKELRFNVYNGVCLCDKCHKEYHYTFMGGVRNLATKESFVDFMDYKICQRLQA